MRDVLLLSILFTTFPLTASADRIKDPVTVVMREVLRRQSDNLRWAADEMPADKYQFKPSPQRISFAQLVINVVESNERLCAVAGGLATPKREALKENAGKEKLVAALKGSFQFCRTALINVHDSRLGDVVRFSSEMRAPRAAALFFLVEDWADSYRMAAVYLRANGLNPPTAAVRD